MKIAAERYPKVVRELLLPSDERMPLDAGMPDAAAYQRLSKLSAADVVGRDGIADQHMAQACLAGLWLLSNHLDESHRISQEIHTPTGAFWHAIMHRREGDYDNAKYWFRQVGDHPAYAVLRRAARDEFIRDKSARATETTRAFAPIDVLALLDGDGPWEPNTFVDLCRAACHNRPDLVKSCRIIQMMEWRALFDHCYERASAR